jgi:hypothetical protein
MRSITINSSFGSVSERRAIDVELPVEGHLDFGRVGVLIDPGHPRGVCTSLRNVPAAEVVIRRQVADRV